MKLSIIIVSWNVRKELSDCLRSISSHRPDCEFETIVVDNASTDGSVEMIKEEFLQVAVIANQENRGFAAANNQALKNAKGDYFFLLNPDTIVHKNSLDNLIRAFDKNPDAGACGPKLLNEDGTIQPSTRYFPTFRAALYANTILKSLRIFRKEYRKWVMKEFDCNRQTDVDQLSGAALMVRRSIIETVGAMDESFFMYYEDVDLCFRIRKAGWRIIYVPNSVITHLGGRSEAKKGKQSPMVKAKVRFINYISIMTFFRKHRGNLLTSLFSIIFKPSVIIKDIFRIFTGFTAYIFFVLLFDRKRQAKSLAKIKRPVTFLTKYSILFLFKT